MRFSPRQALPMVIQATGCLPAQAARGEKVAKSSKAFKETHFLVLIWEGDLQGFLSPSFHHFREAFVIVKFFNNVESNVKEGGE